MKLRKTIAAMSLTVIAPMTLIACGTPQDTASTSTTSSTTSSTSTTTGSTEGVPAGGPGGGGPGGVDVDSVTTEDQVVDMVQAAYGEASLGLHRGHQPIEDVLDEVLTISHDELHVRMEEQGQNLATVAEDLGVDPQTLVDALVDKYVPAVDALAEAGTITAQEADTYTAALEEAFTWRISWDGQESTPTYTGL